MAAIYRFCRFRTESKDIPFTKNTCSSTYVVNLYFKDKLINTTHNAGFTVVAIISLVGNDS